MIKTVEGKNQVQRLAQVRSRIKKLQVIEKELEQSAKEHIKTYGTLRCGVWSAVINIVHTVRPRWKEEFVAKLGEQEAEKIVACTEPSSCEKLEIYKEGLKVA